MVPKTYFGEENPSFEPQSSGPFRDDSQETEGVRMEKHARLRCPSNSWNLFKLIESVVPSNLLILCCPLLLPSVFPSIIESFPVSQFFASGGQSIGVSASASVLPMNIQD